MNSEERHEMSETHRRGPEFFEAHPRPDPKILAQAMAELKRVQAEMEAESREREDG